MWERRELLEDSGGKQDIETDRDDEVSAILLGAEKEIAKEEHAGWENNIEIWKM